MASPASPGDTPSANSKAASADLARLRIDRSTPPSARRSVGRILLFAVLALAVALAAYFAFLREGAPVVQVVTITPVGASGTASGSSLVTANGYVVARTKASVSAKI